MLFFVITCKLRFNTKIYAWAIYKGGILMGAIMYRSTKSVDYSQQTKHHFLAVFEGSSAVPKEMLRVKDLNVPEGAFPNYEKEFMRLLESYGHLPDYRIIVHASVNQHSEEDLAYVLENYFSKPLTAAEESGFDCMPIEATYTLQKPVLVSTPKKSFIDTLLDWIVGPDRRE